MVVCGKDLCSCTIQEGWYTTCLVPCSANNTKSSPTIIQRTRLSLYSRHFISIYLSHTCMLEDVLWGIWSLSEITTWNHPLPYWSAITSSFITVQTNAVAHNIVYSYINVLIARLYILSLRAFERSSICCVTTISYFLAVMVDLFDESEVWIFHILNICVQYSCMHISNLIGENLNDSLFLVNLFS